MKETAARNSDEIHLRKVLDNLFAFVGVMKTDGTLIEANKAPIKAAGLTKKDVLGKKFWDCYWWNYSESTQKRIKKAYKDSLHGKIVRYDVQVRMAKGTLVWIDFQLAPLFDSTGKITHLIPSAMDISDRKKAEDKMKNSIQSFENLANAMPQLVWTADAKGDVDYYNLKYKDFEGITKKGKKYEWAPVIHPEDVDKTVEAWQNALLNGSVYEMEHRIKQKNGLYQWYLSRAIPEKDSTGKVTKWFGTATYIQKAKELEQQKDAFIGIASHELKTPLTSLKVYTQVLKRKFQRETDTKTTAHLHKMDVQIDKISSLISALLDVTQIQSGKLEYHPTTFDMNELLEEVIEEMKMITTSHTFRFQKSGKNEITADRDRIHQVLINLLSNAVKYSPASDTIVVSKTVSKTKMKISVQDFGVGIPAEKISYVFDRFFRAESNGAYPGLGLGLYIASEIIKRHEGAITVNSAVGKGSTFTFTLPLR